MPPDVSSDVGGAGGGGAEGGGAEGGAGEHCAKCVPTVVEFPYDTVLMYLQAG